MGIGIVLVVAGIGLQILGWSRYRRENTKFWVWGKALWYHLYPQGVVLFAIGQLLMLAGAAAYLKG